MTRDIMALSIPKPVAEGQHHDSQQNYLSHTYRSTLFTSNHAYRHYCMSQRNPTRPSY